MLHWFNQFSFKTCKNLRESCGSNTSIYTLNNYCYLKKIKISNFAQIEPIFSELD